MSPLKLVPINLAEANVLVAKWHRHNGTLRGGSFFNVGLIDTDRPEAGYIGAVTAGAVSARGLTVPWACEIRRLVTDGTKNACSMLYGAAWRAAQALGYEGMVTYTLTSEGGKSLRASNWRLDEDHIPTRIWKSRSPEFAHLKWSERPSSSNSPALPRYRWFIGRRIPTQSKLRYADDPPEMGTNPNLDPWNESRKDASTDEPPICGDGVNISTSGLQPEGARETRTPRTRFLGDVSGGSEEIPLP
jgi:hypothetical protein